MDLRIITRPWLLAALALGACADAEEPPAITTEGLALVAFDSCEALERHIEDTAVQYIRNQLGPGRYRGVLLADGVPTAGNARESAGPSAFTRTNTQVAGVDEADFVKTDGRYIYALSANRLHVVKSWPASELAKVASVELDGYPSQMFLDEERRELVVFSSVYTSSERGGYDCLVYGCADWGVATKATVLDVTVPETPRVREELWYPGWLQNARKVGPSIRVVLQDYFRMPPEVRWWPDGELDWSDEDEVESALAALIPENEAIIRAKSLRDWLPEPRRRLSDGTTVELPYDCHDFNRVNAPVDLGFTTVATLNLEDLSRAHRTSIIADTSEVYADADSLYLATRHWWWWPAIGQDDFSYVFKLDTSDPSAARFAAAGGVEGYILNQFSMDEHRGNLRLATTLTRRVEDPDDPDNTWGLLETSNRISVLGEQGGRLVLLGRTEDLAPGERIQSARFVGDDGYVVTFRQVDPLFSLDLRDPAAPRVVGVLKVPGFSTYIHPLDADHLLTIGVSVPDPGANGQVAWQERRMKLSIFDVSDRANPRESFTQEIGTANGYSEAAWEHKAFNYFPEKGLLAIPFADYHPDSRDYWGEFVSDLRVFRVSASAGITPLGAISLSDVFQTYAYHEWSWSWSPWVRRSVMADDFVYAISDAGVRVAHVDALGAPLRTAAFDRVVDLSAR